MGMMELGAVGELVGGFAVVLTLGYLAEHQVHSLSSDPESRGRPGRGEFAFLPRTTISL